MAASVWTIGHSNHQIEKLLDLLGSTAVTTVVDVRSAPYSRFNAQFNRDALRGALETAGIRYRYLGRELGGRPEDPGLRDDDGHALYELMEQTIPYKAGLDEVLRLTAAGYRVCLLCSEEDPSQCHRALSVGYAIALRGIQVLHIRRDGRVIAQNELKGRGLNGPQQVSMFAEVSQRKSLQPVLPARTPKGSSGNSDNTAFED